MQIRIREELRRIELLLKERPQDVALWRRAISLWERTGELPFAALDLTGTEEQQRRSAELLVDMLDAFGWIFIADTRCRPYYLDVLNIGMSLAELRKRELGRQKGRNVHILGACSIPPSGCPTFGMREEECWYTLGRSGAINSLTCGQLCLMCQRKLQDPEQPLLRTMKDLRKRRLAVPKEAGELTKDQKKARRARGSAHREQLEDLKYRQQWGRHDDDGNQIREEPF